MEKPPEFVARRRENWAFLRRALESLQGRPLFPEPDPERKPSWFGFFMTVRPERPVSRDELVSHLEAHNVQTRPIFAGTLAVTDRVMNSSFWAGVYPGMERGDAGGDCRKDHRKSRFMNTGWRKDE